ncbi:MAG: glucoamylase family protein, partial [Bacteroidota bacterium]|nr:glucoamylase family protein [Bacteroidota bacterium]
MPSKLIYNLLLVLLLTNACKKQSNPTPPPGIPSSFSFNTLKVNGIFNGFTYNNINIRPVIKFSFSAAINHASTVNSFSFKDAGGTVVAYSTAFENHDSTVVIFPSQPLQYLTRYNIDVTTSLKSVSNGSLQTAVNVQLTTTIDSTNKFPVVTDDQLLDIVQKQTFKYFWDFGHPVSGLARERNSSGDVVTMGGSGFGIMAIVVAVYRQFITRAEGLARMQKIVGFLKNTAQKFHGAFPHWMNGVTGAVVPFNAQDDGADLVETSFLMEGLLTARQFFNGATVDEINLVNDINMLWNNVEWSWFRQGNQNVLYWHWSPDHGWAINMPIHGWDEALMPYVFGASSTTFPIPKIVYNNGWAGNGSMKNGNSYYNIILPLGPVLGGPLFFEHYSFMGINPKGLTDAYANYETQTRAHSLINYNYCVSNP